MCKFHITVPVIRRNRHETLNARRCSATNKSQEREISGKTRQTSLWDERKFVFYCYIHSPWLTELEIIIASPPYGRIAMKIIFNQSFNQISSNLVMSTSRQLVTTWHIECLRLVYGKWLTNFWGILFFRAPHFFAFPFKRVTFTYNTSLKKPVRSWKKFYLINS